MSESGFLAIFFDFYISRDPCQLRHSSSVVACFNYSKDGKNLMDLLS